MLQVHGLTKRYGAVTAADGVDLTIEPGVVYGLLGPNGAGKTTTLEIVEGLRRPDGGSVRYGEVDLLAHPVEARERFGVQLQTSSFFDLLTVEETLDLFGSFYHRGRLPSRHLVVVFGLEEKRHTLVQRLSGGQRQRLAIAAALVNDPEVVFLDEPTAGLDPQSRRSLWETVSRLKEEGRTVVLTTHYMDEAEALCDQLSIMDHGRVLATGSPQELIRRYLPGAVIELGAEVPLPSDLELPALVRVERSQEGAALISSRLEETLIGLVNWAREHSQPLPGLRTRAATLEDVFLHLTGRSLRD